MRSHRRDISACLQGLVTGAGGRGRASGATEFARSPAVVAQSANQARFCTHGAASVAVGSWRAWCDACGVPRPLQPERAQSAPAPPLVPTALLAALSSRTRERLALQVRITELNAVSLFARTACGRRQEVTPPRAARAPGRPPAPGMGAAAGRPPSGGGRELAEAGARESMEHGGGIFFAIY